MRIRKREIINLPVYSESGQHLGRVVDFEFDSASHIILIYYVRSKDIIKELLQKELLVSKDQVLSIDQEKMVVEDNTILITEKKKVALAS